jgi:cytochrome c5
VVVRCSGWLALLGLALITACGKTEDGRVAANAVPPQAAPAATVQPVSAQGQGEPGKGEHVYKVTCAMCHGTGAGGAPLFKSKDDWSPRIAQGKDTLYTHALGGFTGAKGTMPAKGGNPSLADADVKAGVDYMVSKAQ